MKLLGIDYGDKRVGIALTDESGAMAFPKEILENDGQLVNTITKIIKEEGVEAVVIGESHDFGGKENPIMKRIHHFVERLTGQVSLPIYFEPEFMTSAEARRGQEDVKIVDSGAATIILQSYIDKKKKND